MCGSRIEGGQESEKEREAVVKGGMKTRRERGECGLLRKLGTFHSLTRRLKISVNQKRKRSMRR